MGSVKGEMDQKIKINCYFYACIKVSSDEEKYGNILDKIWDII